MFSLIVLTVIVLTLWNKGGILAQLWLLFIIKILKLILDSRDHLKYLECMQTVCFCSV